MYMIYIFNYLIIIIKYSKDYYMFLMNKKAIIIIIVIIYDNYQYNIFCIFYKIIKNK